MSGYISIYRQIEDNFLHPLKQDRKFTSYEAWIDLISKAYFRDTKKLIQGKIILIKRGCFDTSTLQLSERWKWHRNTTEKFLKLLEKEQMITRTKINSKNQKSCTILKINKYEEFQNKVNSGCTTECTTECTPNNKENKIEGEREEKNLQLTGNFYNYKNEIPDKKPFIVNGEFSEYIFHRHTEEERKKLFDEFGEDIISEIIGDLEELAKKGELKCLQSDKTIPFKAMYKFGEYKFNKRNNLLCRTTK